MRRAWIACALALLPGPAFAWGAVGHRLVGQVGAEAFSAELPAFLRAPGVARDIG